MMMMMGTDLHWYVSGGANYMSEITASASILDLHANDMTIDGYFCPTTTAVTQYFCEKGVSGVSGWQVYIRNNGKIKTIIKCATTNAISETNDGIYGNGLRIYLKMTYQNAGDRKPYIYINNVLVAQGQVAGIDAITSDVGANGHISQTSNAFTGYHGWVRWSNIVRGTGLLPRWPPPDIDANTVAQWNCQDGVGAILTDSSGNANHGAMTGTYTWMKK
jgi:hypothetical protein